MKKRLFFLALAVSFTISASAHAATWTPTTPPGYTPLEWVGSTGVKSFMKAPVNSGYINYLTIVYLPQTQIQLIASSTPKVLKGAAVEPFASASTTAENWAFAKTMVETFKAANPQITFLWNAPFFNMNMPVTELSLGLKSTDANGAYITSGARPAFDMEQPRRMLIIDNAAGTASIADFNEDVFVKKGDQAVEGFSPNGSPSAKSEQAARVFLGVRNNGTELVVFCSRSASLDEASAALSNAGVALENQMQVDGGGSATCAYNLPGQYFVEPNRSLPHIMGVIAKLPKGNVTIDKLNVRAGAGTGNKALRQLPIGTEVTIYEETNGWYRISKTGSEWVSAQYVKKPVTYPYDAITAIDQLNVRSGAGTGFAAMRKLKIGTAVKVYEEKSGWARIGDTEWVSAQYIK